MDQLAERQYRSRSDIIRQAVLRELEANGLCPIVLSPQSRRQCDSRHSPYGQDRRAWYLHE